MMRPLLLALGLASLFACRARGEEGVDFDGGVDFGEEDDEYGQLYDTAGIFLVEQSIGEKEPFVHRGTIKIDSLRTATRGTITQNSELTDEQRTELAAAARNGDIVRVRVREESSEVTAAPVSFTPACTLVASNLMDSLALYISRDLELTSISYMTKEKRCKPQATLKATAHARTRVVIVRGDDAPLPNTDGFAPEEPAVPKGLTPGPTDTKPKEEPSFLGKYWHLIALGVIWVQLRASKAGATEENEGGAKKQE